MKLFDFGVAAFAIFLLLAGFDLLPNKGALPEEAVYPAEYVAEKGDCFVPPQGDPLYDAHYAEHVNVPNCAAFADRGQAKALEAQAEVLGAQAEIIRVKAEQARIKIGLQRLGFGVAGIVFLAIIVAAAFTRMQRQ